MSKLKISHYIAGENSFHNNIKKGDKLTYLSGEGSQEYWKSERTGLEYFPNPMNFKIPIWIPVYTEDKSEPILNKKLP